MKDIKQKYGEWAVITGASDGIGRAFAEQLSKEGINLLLIARRKEQLKDISNELTTRYGNEIRVFKADLSEPHEIFFAQNEMNKIDFGLFIAAAGFGTSGAFGDIPLEQELNMVDLNCRTVLSQSHYAVERFKQRGGGALVLLASLVGFQGTPRAANYAATKAYVQTLAEGLREELKDHNVDVLAVAPGPVKTGFAYRADMKMSGADQPSSVALGALNALGKSMTVRPGFMSKLLGYSLSLLPRWGRIKVMASVMGGMTKHQVEGN